MALLADFSERVDLPGGPVWPMYGRAGAWLAPPTQVSLAIGGDGRPLFHLALIRSDTPDAPPAPFGMLDLTLKPRRDLDAALEELRATLSGVTLLPAQLDRAALDLGWEGQSDPGVDEPVISAHWQDSDQARIIQQMELSSALSLAGQLETHISPLILRGAASVLGVSPRVATVARPSTVVATELETEMGGAAFTRDTLFFALLSIGVIAAARAEPRPSVARSVALADALADRISQDWCVIVGRTPSNLPLFAFAESIEPAEWDLSRPTPVSRWVPLDQTLATPLADYIRDHGAAQVISRPVIPRFPKGRHRITAYANLPLGTPVVHMLNLSLLAPPHPPDRPSAAHAVGQIDPTSGVVSVDLTLALSEPLSYQVECFAVVGQGADIRQIFGPLRTSDNQILTLNAADFGMQVLHHRVDPGLLALADLKLTERYVSQGVMIETSLDLTTPEMITVLPADASQGGLHLSALEKDGPGEILLPDLPLAALDIGLALFPGYGRQEAVIEMTPAPATAIGVDVLPGHAGEDGLQTFAFTADRTERHFVYHAASPFAPGFRWRLTGAREWTLHADPTQILDLQPPV